MSGTSPVSPDQERKPKPDRPSELVRMAEAVLEADDRRLVPRLVGPESARLPPLGGKHARLAQGFLV
jgi:hypothetical protein